MVQRRRRSRDTALVRSLAFAGREDVHRRSLGAFSFFLPFAIRDPRASASSKTSSRSVSTSGSTGSSHRGSPLVAASHNPAILPCSASWFVAAGGSHRRVTASTSHLRCVATSSAPGKTTQPGRLASSYASRGAVSSRSPLGISATRRTPCSPPPASASARRSRESSASPKSVFRVTSGPPTFFFRRVKNV